MAILVNVAPITVSEIAFKVSFIAILVRKIAFKETFN